MFWQTFVLVELWIRTNTESLKNSVPKTDRSNITVLWERASESSTPILVSLVAFKILFFHSECWLFFMANVLQSHGWDLHMLKLILMEFQPIFLNNTFWIESNLWLISRALKKFILTIVTFLTAFMMETFLLQSLVHF